MGLIGLARTKDVVMRSRRISGEQARDWGIVVDCVAVDQLVAATDALVAELVAFSPLAQRTAKKLLNDSENATVASGVSWRATVIAACANPKISQKAFALFTKNAARIPRMLNKTPKNFWRKPDET